MISEELEDIMHKNDLIDILLKILWIKSIFSFICLLFISTHLFIEWTMTPRDFRILLAWLLGSQSYLIASRIVIFLYGRKKKNVT